MATRTIATAVFLWLAGMSPALAQTVATTAQSQRSYIETIRDLERAVVPVICAAPTDDGQLDVGAWVGTAFFVDRAGTFMTAAHVVTKVREQTGPTCEPAIYVPVGGWQHGDVRFRIRIFPFTECAVHDLSIDVSVCKTDVNLERDPVGKELSVLPVIFNEDIPPIGTDISFTGFPLGTRQPVTSRGMLAGFGADSGRPRSIIVIDKNAWGGLSGGPLYLEDGRVIGIIVEAGFSDSAGLTYARAAAYLTPAVAAAKRAVSSEQTRRR